MRSSNIQIELLSETRTPQQIWNYAINRERGQANQLEINRVNSNSKGTQVNYLRQNRPRQQTQSASSNKNTLCWKCGSQFNSTHLLNCSAKNSTCNICNRVLHFTSQSKAKLPERKDDLQDTTTINKMDNTDKKAKTEKYVM